MKEPSEEPRDDVAKVLTITANPSIDVSAVAPRVTTEHKLRCTDVHRDPGGGGINVARVLQRFGVRCQALYPAGGILGRLLQHLLEQEGVPSLALEIANETRESFTVLDRATGREYRFVLPGPELSEPEWRGLIDRLRTLPKPPEYVVASGSLPVGAPDDFYRRVAEAARARGSRMVVDASGKALAAALDGGVHLVKPNLRELRELTGEALEEESEWVRAAHAIVDAGRAEIVALSLGHRGAVLATADLTLRAPALQVEIASTVGAGDCFLGAMVWRLASGDDLESAFRHAIAAGTAALLAPGTSLATKEDTERLAAQVDVRRLTPAEPS